MRARYLSIGGMSEKVGRSLSELGLFRSPAPPVWFDWNMESELRFAHMFTGCCAGVCRYVTTGEMTVRSALDRR